MLVADPACADGAEERRRRKPALSASRTGYLSAQETTRKPATVVRTIFVTRESNQGWPNWIGIRTSQTSDRRTASHVQFPPLKVCVLLRLGGVRPDDCICSGFPHSVRHGAGQ